MPFTYFKWIIGNGRELSKVSESSQIVRPEPRGRTQSDMRLNSISNPKGTKEQDRRTESSDPEPHRSNGSYQLVTH